MLRTRRKSFTDRIVVAATVAVICAACSSSPNNVPFGLDSPTTDTSTSVTKDTKISERHVLGADVSLGEEVFVRVDSAERRAVLEPKDLGLPADGPMFYSRHTFVVVSLELWSHGRRAYIWSGEGQTLVTIPQKGGDVGAEYRVKELSVDSRVESAVRPVPRWIHPGEMYSTELVFDVPRASRVEGLTLTSYFGHVGAFVPLPAI